MLSRVVKSIQIGSTALKQYSRLPLCTQIRQFSDIVDGKAAGDTSASNTETNSKLGSFAKAFEEFEKLNAQAEVAVPVDNIPFKKLFRESKFIDLGDPLNKIVVGKIVHIVGDDLYIDFGWKFNCVCFRPQKNGDLYVRGAVVKLRIKELELSSRFLGEEKDLTILEADCKLIGLISTPVPRKER